MDISVHIFRDDVGGRERWMNGRGARAHGYLPGTSSVYMYTVLVRGEEERDSAKRERTRRTHARAYPARFPNACGARGMTSTAGEEGQRRNTENEY